MKKDIFESALTKSLVRFFRCILDSTTYGILAVLNVGNKKVVPKIQNEILLIPAVHLAAKIRRGELSSETVVKAYIDRIIEVNDLINAVVDTRYTEALEEARKVDQLIRSGIMTEHQMAEDLPLLGVPFTSKLALLVKGLASDCGLVCRKGFVAEKDCESVKILRSCGAIPVGVTNVSEVCLCWETDNKVHGRTKNPYDTKRTPGGSTGGEGAIIAAAGSVIGLGADLGGSIRLPAFFNGIFGHKPTQGLVSLDGIYPPVFEEIEDFFANGPLVRYASDLKLVLSALIGKEATQKLKLFNPVDIRSIKIYYMLDDGGSPFASPVSPEIQKGIEKVVKMLSDEGCRVKRVDLKYIKYGFHIWTASLSKVKKKIANYIQGETATEEKGFLPKEMCKWIIGKSVSTSPILWHVFLQECMAPLFSDSLNFYLNYSEKTKRELLSLLEPESAVFLYPTYPHVASYNGQMLFKPFNVGYCAAFNAAQLPVTQCPLGFNSSGLPLGMQIVTAPNNDRLSIAIAEYVEVKFGGWTEPASSVI